MGPVNWHSVFFLLFSLVACGFAVAVVLTSNVVRMAFFLVVALGRAHIDLKSLHKRIASDRLSFGKPELLMEVLGVPPGSVTPFALINDTGRRVTVILDADMMKHERLNYHPLENTATTNIAREDLLRFIRACGHEPRIMAVSAAG